MYVLHKIMISLVSIGGFVKMDRALLYVYAPSWSDFRARSVFNDPH